MGSQLFTSLGPRLFLHSKEQLLAEKNFLVAARLTGLRARLAGQRPPFFRYILFSYSWLTLRRLHRTPLKMCFTLYICS